MPLLAKDALSKKTLFVDKGVPLSDTMEEIHKRRASHIAILTRGHCLGVSNVEDAGSLPVDTTLEELVQHQTHPVTSKSTTLEELGQVFSDPNIDVQIVNDDQGNFVGVVTRQSLLEALLEERSTTESPTKSTDFERMASLRENEEKLRTILETTSDWIWEMDLEGVHSFSNDCLEKFLGYTLEEFASFELNELIHPDDWPEVEARWPKLISTQSGWSKWVVRFRHKQGGYRSLESSAVPVFDSENVHIGYRGIDRDVTERIESELLLRESEARFRNLFENAPDAIFLLNDGVWTDCNQAALSMLRGTREQIIGHSPADFSPEFQPDGSKSETKATEYIQEALETGSRQFEWVHRCLEGTDIWTEILVAAIAHKGHSSVYGIVRDITERKQASEDARKHQEELAHVARISTMGEMATGIAHELNQPLSAIASYSFIAKDLTENGSVDQKKLQETLAKLENQSIRAGDIVRRLREFLKKPDSTRVKTDLNAIIQEVVKFVEHDIHKADAILILKLEESPSEVLVDKIQIQQVLVNLIRNALDAMQETPIRQREVTVSTRTLQDGHAEVIVSDAGKGLAQNELEQVFDTFFTTKQEGMGMGLPISRSIVESHGGKLWSKSNIDAGATFRFTIPRENHSHPNQKRTISIVDDEEAMRDSLRLILESMGYLTICFASAVELLDRFEQNKAPDFDFLITDVQMPKVSGIELLQQLNSMDIDVPIIMISGHGTTELKTKAKELGSIAFIEKPFHPGKLQEIIANQLEQNADTKV